MEAFNQIETLTQEYRDVPFAEKLKESGIFPLQARTIEILQMNITRRCNLSCKHCHVGAGPDRTESMPRKIMDKCIEIAQSPTITTLDITGGAPEMHPDFEWFLEQTSRLKKRTIVRSNLVILTDPKFKHFADLYARHGIEVVGSLPDYRKERSEKQRGHRSFDLAIEAISLLNSRGYGTQGSELVLDLVHNPAGAFLCGSQKGLEREYKSQLAQKFGVTFNNLFCLTNCPVGRYLEFLIRSDNFEDYMSDLLKAFNPVAAQKVMCRTTLSIGWDGTLYDCDFNQMLGISVNHGAPNTIDTFDLTKLENREIVINNHCFSCTAGSGSSCQGALED